MKKSILPLMIMLTFLLTGCQPKEQITSFIPTQVPNQDVEETPVDGAEENTENTEDITPAPSELHVGQTTPMYVKLDEYGAYLNIRSTPSTEGAPVGFLVHAEKIDVIEIADGWASFVYEGAVCYVKESFLVKEKPAYLEPPTSTPAPTPTKKPVTTPDI